jgi:kynurenine formamidase
MGKTRIIDLSMEVHPDMMRYPGVRQPIIECVENHAQHAQNTGATKYGVTELCAQSNITMSDHTGTHIDSLWHADPTKPTAEAIPLEYCYGDGVVLDVSYLKPGDGISAKDLQGAAAKINYKIKPLDIVLIQTNASRKNTTPAYLTDHPGMTREGVLWLLDQGVKVIGIDSVGFDPPVPAMFERKQFWEAHKVMREREYYHLENMANLDQIPKPYGFKVSVLPIKLRGATAAPVRAVAIVEE